MKTHHDPSQSDPQKPPHQPQPPPQPQRTDPLKTDQPSPQGDPKKRQGDGNTQPKSKR